MRKRMISTLLVAGLLVFGAGSALGSGFSIYEAGSKATALGCAFTATADAETREEIVQRLFGGASLDP